MKDMRSPEDFDMKTWKPREKAVLVFMVDRGRNKILLIHKKTGLGKGKINGPGGRIEPGETPKAAAIRECREEVSLTPLNPEKRGELFFRFTSGYSLYGEVFLAGAWEGDMRESDEAAPFWCGLDKIPWDKMWEDDKEWLPGILAGKKHRGYYVFDEDKMVSARLEEVERFDD